MHANKICKYTKEHNTDNFTNSFTPLQLKLLRVEKWPVILKMEMAFECVARIFYEKLFSSTLVNRNITRGGVDFIKIIRKYLKIYSRARLTLSTNRLY